MLKPLIINLAPTGMLPTKEMTPHVPITPDEIVEDVTSCISLGVSMVHLHARDAQGKPAFERSYFQEIIPKIRSAYPDTVITVTTSGRNNQEFDKRTDALKLVGDAKPDMGSLTLSSLNFNRVASINSPDMIMQFAAEMRERGIKPELEVFDLGMVNFAHYLIKKDLIEPPYYFNIILGNIASAQAKLLHLGLIVSELPQPCVWSVAGIGDAQLHMNAIGAIAGDGIRIGLEDNIWFDAERTQLATNMMLVERMLPVVKALGRSIATGQVVRNMLNLQGGKWICRT